MSAIVIDTGFESESVVSWMSVHGEITYVSPEAHQLFGCDPSRLCGRHAGELFTDEDWHAIVRLRDRLDAGDATARKRVGLCLPNGRRLDVMVRGSAILDPQSGRARAYHLVLTPIVIREPVA